MSAEDLILLKLAANRPRDKADIQDVLAMHVRLDESYINHWAEKLGVTQAWQESLAEFRQ